MKRLTSAWISLMLFAGVALAQENAYLKNFKLFKEIAPGVDFYAANQNDITPFVKPVVDARKKLSDYLGVDLARGAIFVCSNLKQKDAVYDSRTFKLGYKWYLIQLTPEAQREDRQARMQAVAAAAAALGQGDQAGGQNGRSGGRGGGQDQAGNRQRGTQNQQGTTGQRGGQTAGQRGAGPGGQEARAAVTLATQMGYASLMMTFAPEKPYRLSRIDDLGRSPLVDWLDVSLVADATGTGTANLRFLQDRIDEAFPLDDVLIMNRPFVAQQDSGGGGGGMGGGGGQTMVIMGGGGAGMQGPGGANVTFGGNQGTASPQGGGRGGAGRVLPKDQQDRMLFDAQASSFLYYLREKAGIEKVQEVVRRSIKGEESLNVVQEFLGKDFDKVERDWQAWLKTQKPAEPMRTNGPGD